LNKILKIGVGVMFAAAICLPFTMNVFAGVGDTKPDKFQQFIQDWEKKAANAPKAQKGDPSAERPKYQPAPIQDKEMAVTKNSGAYDVDRSIELVTVYGYSSPSNGGIVSVASGYFRDYDASKGAWVDDTQDGVLAVTTTVNGQRDYQVYHSPEKHGALKMISVDNRRVVNIEAGDGKQYSFDLKTTTFEAKN
jgi:hypothetical protein